MIGKLILLLLVALSPKSIPFAWHFKFFSNVLKYLILANPKDIPASIFDPVDYHTRCSLFECDFNMHKSNSTYFSDLDNARGLLMLKTFKNFFNSHKKQNGSYPYLPLGGVLTVFKKEIKPLQAYNVKSRILGWDQKWLFVLSRFETVGRDGKPVLCAVALTKYVFKIKRKTVPPETVIAESKLDVKEEDLKRGRISFEQAKAAMELGDLAEETF